VKADSTDTVNYKGIEFTPNEFLQLLRSNHKPPIAKIKKNIDAAELVLGRLDQLIRTSENPAFILELRQCREHELRFKEMQQNFLNAFEGMRHQS
jgi:hypothetical protein